MEQKNTFSYTYSAQENQEAQNIRNRYLPRQESPLEALKALDAKVKRPANVFAYTFGAISAVVMGAGMSLVMTDIGALLGMTETMIPGIGIGLVGMGMALLTYPMYKSILARRRRKYAPRILELSQQIVSQ